MSNHKVKEILNQKFNDKKIDSIINYFLSCIQKFEEGDWEGSLSKAGKFVEATVKLLWVYSGNILPGQKSFKAGLFAQKIANLDSAILPDSLRLQISRACIFLYDVTSNRGARHDPDELDPNEMDASCILPICSWILAELIRFGSKDFVSPAEAKKIVDSLIERRYPAFEEIEGRIYVDSAKFKSVPECALLILYKKYPKRMSREELVETLMRHDFKKTAVKVERLAPYIDIDNSGNMLLRATGRKQAEQILKSKQSKTWP